MKTKVLVFVLGLLLYAARGTAQEPLTPPEPDGSDVRVRIGALWINPSLSLTDLGVDTNVFNDADEGSPKRDFTGTITPRADLWVRMGRTWLTGVVKEDLVWYQEYSSQRSTNESYTIGWTAPLARVTASAEANWLTTRDRPGFEIDSRSRRTEQGFRGALELRALSRTLVGVKGSRRRVQFAPDEIFNGRSLDLALSRTETAGAVSLRHELTPLTSLTLDVGRQEDRFEFEPLRDSMSTQALFGVNFDPHALIKGTAQVGFRRFDPVTPGVPGYDGSTVAVNLSYVALGATRFGVQGVRDVQYSYDVNQPYYLQTGFSGSLMQQIFGPIDAEVRAGTRHLAYRDRTDVTVAVPNRLDRVRTYGGSVGYRMGPDLRVAYSMDRQERKSEVVGSQYKGLRYGMSMSLGF